jgi:Family of unknown function (DUF5681)
MSQKVTVSEGGRTRRVSRLEVMLLRLANDAARGDARATKLLLELKDRYGQPIDGGGPSEELSSDDLKILAAYSTQSLDSRANRGQHEKKAESAVLQSPVVRHPGRKRARHTAARALARARCSPNLAFA